MRSRLGGDRSKAATNGGLPGAGFQLRVGGRTGGRTGEGGAAGLMSTGAAVSGGDTVTPVAGAPLAALSVALAGAASVRETVAAPTADAAARAPAPSIVANNVRECMYFLPWNSLITSP